LAVVAGVKNRMTMQKRQKSNAKFKKKVVGSCYYGQFIDSSKYVLIGQNFTVCSTFNIHYKDLPRDYQKRWSKK